MRPSKEQLEGLDVVLDEALLAGVEVDPQSRKAGTTVEVLRLPDKPVRPSDNRILLVLEPIGRVAASLRHGRWDDAAAEVESLSLEDLENVFERVGGGSLYGYQYFDVPEERPGVFKRKNGFALWSDRLSLDWRAGDGAGLSHTLLLFQEGFEGTNARHLDIQLWFDELELFDADHEPLVVDEVIAEARRWWKAFREFDPRTTGPQGAAGDRTIVPLT